MSSLYGRHALVTGAGTGIGKAIAVSLATAGATVTICGRTESTLAAACEQIAADGSGEASYVIADVTSEGSVEEACAAASSESGELHICVANAGGGGMLGRLHTQDAAEFDRVLRLNVTGTFLTMKHALPRMIRAGGGAFVAISSIAGHLTHPFFGAYPPGKAGIEQLVRNAADEYGADGIRCNAIRPGFVATEIMDVIPRDSEIYDSYVRNTPLGRLGEPADIAALARFLVSDEAEWLTGAVIDLDGGQSLRRGPNYQLFAAPG